MEKLTKKLETQEELEQGTREELGRQNRGGVANVDHELKLTRQKSDTRKGLRLWEEDEEEEKVSNFMLKIKREFQRL